MLTVIAYRENGDDDGDAYDSEMEWISSDNEEKLVEFISDHMMKNHYYHKHYEGGCDFTYINHDGTEYNHDYDHTEFSPVVDDSERLFQYKLEVEEKRLDDERKAYIQRRKQAEAEQQRLRDQNELAEYKRLHKKYGANA
jgi:hypothetical protein